MFSQAKCHQTSRIYIEAPNLVEQTNINENFFLEDFFFGFARATKINRKNENK